MILKFSMLKTSFFLVLIVASTSASADGGAMAFGLVNYLVVHILDFFANL